MRHRIYEVDSEGLLHDNLDIEESEDVMDLDDADILNFTDINHEIVSDRRHEGRGFYEQLESLLPEDDDIEAALNDLDRWDAEEIVT